MCQSYRKDPRNGERSTRRRRQPVVVVPLGIVSWDAPARRTVMLVDPRRERLDDRGAVRDLHLVAFGDQGEVVAGLVDELRRDVSADVGASLVAEV